MRSFLMCVLFVFACCAAVPVAPESVGTVRPTSDHIELHGEIDDNSIATFLQDLKAWEATGAESVVVSIDSPGGSVFSGLDAVKALKNAKIKVTCVANPLALSMAFVIFEACEKRVVVPETLIMGHRVSGGSSGNSDDLRKTLELMDALDFMLASVITERSKWTVAEYLQRTEHGREVWLTAKDMLLNGFADEMQPSVSVAISHR